MFPVRFFGFAAIAFSLLTIAWGAHGQSNDSPLQAGFRAFEAGRNNEAARLFQQACDEGVLMGCAERGRMARTGEAHLP